MQFIRSHHKEQVHVAVRVDYWDEAHVELLGLDNLTSAFSLLALFEGKALEHYLTHCHYVLTYLVPLYWPLCIGSNLAAPSSIIGLKQNLKKKFKLHTVST